MLTHRGGDDNALEVSGIIIILCFFAEQRRKKKKIVFIWTRWALRAWWVYGMRKRKAFVQYGGRTAIFQANTSCLKFNIISSQRDRMTDTQTKREIFKSAPKMCRECVLVRARTRTCTHAHIWLGPTGTKRLFNWMVVGHFEKWYNWKVVCATLSIHGIVRLTFHMGSKKWIRMENVSSSKMCDEIGMENLRFFTNTHNLRSLNATIFNANIR